MTRNEIDALTFGSGDDVDLWVVPLDYGIYIYTYENEGAGHILDKREVRALKRFIEAWEAAS